MDEELGTIGWLSIFGKNLEMLIDAREKRREDVRINVQLTKRLIGGNLHAELTGHLGYEPCARKGHGVGNCRSVKAIKTLQSDSGPIQMWLVTAVLWVRGGMVSLRL